MRSGRIAAGIAAGVAACAAVVVMMGGPTNPPPGPVSSQYKTLAEVEPRTAVNAANTPGDADSLFKITQPGSYYLTGNITGVVGKHGVEIAASGVTLDLNGFDLVGVPGSLDGVTCTLTNANDLAVSNGSIRAWQGDGVDLLSSSGLNCRFADLRAQGNTGNGMAIGIGGTVSSCTAFGNGGNGIITSFGCAVTDCSAWGNSGSGANLALSCTITGFAAYSNTTAGITAARECTITACTTRGGNVGISAGAGSTITGCTANFSNGNGINTGDGCTVSNCAASSNTGNGISATSGCTVTNCAASSNTGNGISTSFACTVTNCTVYGNIGNGISTGFGSTIADCTARNNTLDGILCSSSCVIRGNTCATNGNGGDSAGVHATGNDNRIEGNNCTLADRGIDVDAVSNIIIKNTCSVNTTNWDIAIGNALAPIVAATTNAAAVAGNTYAGSLGSTDPNANFTY